MKRKWDDMTRKVYKHKACLNVNRGKQDFGIDYFQTHLSTFNWFSIRVIMLMSIINNWNIRQIDFVLSYPRVDVECDLHMKLPNGFKTSYGDSHVQVWLLKINWHGQKQTGRTWNQHLIKELKKIGFKPSATDECVCMKANPCYFVASMMACLMDPTTWRLSNASKT